MMISSSMSSVGCCCVLTGVVVVELDAIGAVDVLAVLLLLVDAFAVDVDVDAVDVELVVVVVVVAVTGALRKDV